MEDINITSRKFRNRNSCALKIALVIALLPSISWAGPEIAENDVITDPHTIGLVGGRMNEDGTTISATEGDALMCSLDSAGRLLTKIDAFNEDVVLNTVVVDTGGFQLNLQAMQNGGDNGILAFTPSPVFVVSDTAETGSTASVITATSHVARVGDIIEFTSGTAGNIGANAFVCEKAANTITLCGVLPATPVNTDAFSIYRMRVAQSLFAEDSAHTSGDFGVNALAVVDDNTPTVFSGTEGDYVPLKVASGTGALHCSLTQAYQASAGDSPIKREDNGYTSADAIIAVGSARDDSISVDASADDWQPLKSDKFGRLLVSAAPDAHLFSCVSSADITDTNSTEVCAADADEIYVIQDICCSNTDATVATRVNILHNATVVHTMVLAANVAAAPGDSNSCQTFPGGIKGAAINNAINAQNITTSAEVRCSIHGYKVPS